MHSRRTFLRNCLLATGGAAALRLPGWAAELSELPVGGAPPALEVPHFASRLQASRRELLIQEVVPDAVVPNLATEQHARLLGLSPLAAAQAHPVTGAKGAVVPHPDGRHRLLCAIESPESWFEDFGEATLHGGLAEVELDAEFAQVVLTDRYHVFLTPYGPCDGL